MIMRVMRGLLAVFLLSSVSRVTAACFEGCNADFQPTLATNKLIYRSDCVARCQGASVESAGAIQERADARPVTMADMGAHADAGFHFVDFARLGRVGTGPDAASGSSCLKDLPLDRVVLFDVARGAIYTTTSSAQLPALPAAAISTAAVAAQPGVGLYNVEGRQNPELQVTNAATDLAGVVEPLQSSRKLKLLQVADQQLAAGIAAPAAPAADANVPAAVGQLLTFGQIAHCTASLIGERTIITAAHCVYDRSSGVFLDALYFVPGRFRDAAGHVHAPYGAYNIAEVYLSSQFVAGASADMVTADVAVLRLHTHVQVGKVAGFLGIAVQAVDSRSTAGTAAAVQEAQAAGISRSVARRTLLSAQQQLSEFRTAAATAAEPEAAVHLPRSLFVAGYPSDQPEGSPVSTKCQAELITGAAAGLLVKLVDCDLTAGQSGAPLMNHSNQIHGLASFTSTDVATSGTAITHYIYNTLIRPYVV